MDKFKWEVSRDAAWTDNYLTVQAEAEAQQVDAEARYKVVLRGIAEVVAAVAMLTTICVVGWALTFLWFLL